MATTWLRKTNVVTRLQQHFLPRRIVTGTGLPAISATLPWSGGFRCRGQDAAPTQAGGLSGTHEGHCTPRDANQRQRGLKHTVGFEAHGRFKIMGFNCLVKLETHSGTGWWKRAKMIARPNAQISGQSAKLTPPLPGTSTPWHSLHAATRTQAPAQQGSTHTLARGPTCRP